MTVHAAPDEVVLRAEGVNKIYGATHALKGVDFEVRAGKVTALFGENGAGKSTLMKILSGVEQPTSGALYLDGEPITLRSTTQAVDLGISIIHQELNLCPNLTVSDNIFLGREAQRSTGFIDFKAEEAMTQAALDLLEEDISPNQLVADLRLGQQQIVEIAKALAANTRILIMDEPTSALSQSEVEVLFKIIRGLTAKGVAIVYISHHLEEALEIADYAVVFRDGRLIATEHASDVDLPWLVQKMVGREAEYDFRDAPRDFGDVRLKLDNVSVINPEDSQRVAVRNLDLEVRAGEIVCLYGLMGAGRSELLETLAGRMFLADGTVSVDGKNVDAMSIQERIDYGMGLVPEDRQRDGLIPIQTVGFNLMLSSLYQAVKGFMLSRGKQRELAEVQIKDVRIKTEGPGAPITSLSGGNQQKVVIGKLLMTQPRVLLLDEPTRGIDVGAKGEIFELMFEQAKSGLAVLYATSEVGEALTASHRIVVMGRGRIVREFDSRVATREAVMAASGEAAASTRPDGATK